MQSNAHLDPAEGKDQSVSAYVSAGYQVPNHTKYVVGFLFNKDASLVALIQKERPTWQKGKLNGIGGHIEKDEDMFVAMEREFREETTISIPQWRHYLTLCGREFTLDLFTARYDNLLMLQSPTDEKVRLFPVANIGTDPRIIPNLKWLVPLALDAFEPQGVIVQ